MSHPDNTPLANLKVYEATSSLESAWRLIDAAQTQLSPVRGMADEYDRLGQIRIVLADLISDLVRARGAGGLHLDSESEAHR